MELCLIEMDTVSQTSEKNLIVEKFATALFTPMYDYCDEKYACVWYQE